MPPPTYQRVLWIALPRGAAVNGKAHLSVIVSPHLRTSQGHTLELFPDFLNWAERMQPARISFRVEVDGGPVVPASVVSDPPHPELWQAAFGRQTPVRPYQFDDYSDRPLVTYPVGRLLTYLKERYQAVAAQSPVDLPTEIALSSGEQDDLGLRELVGAFQREGPFANVENQRDFSARLTALAAREKDRAAARRATHVGAPISDADGAPLIAAQGPTVADGFSQAVLFHHRPAMIQPVDLPDNEADARNHFEESIDFHRMLAALGDYPALLRMLGLAFDLELPEGALPETTAAVPARKLRVVPAWTSDMSAGATMDYLPWTVYTFDRANGRPALWPASRTGENTRGFWTPPAGQIELVPVDIDGATLKTWNLAGTLARVAAHPEDRALDAPDRTGLAALRSGGLSVIRSGHAAEMNGSFNRAHNLNLSLEANPPVLADLFAEDLTRGYRLDLRDDTRRRWYSLHARRGTYRFLDAAEDLPEIVDEGCLQLSVAGPAIGSNTPPDPDAELYIHESVATWDGWSLSVPRPGKSISRSPRAPTAGDQETQLQRVPNRALTKLRLETSFRAEPASLPRLRFGNVYRVRFRTVDLAGNSLTLQDADAALEDPGLAHAELGRVIYTRYEPIVAPVLVPSVSFAEGESLERLVIRSMHDMSADAYALLHPHYTAFSDRHVAPPKGSQLLAEQHGVFEKAFDAKTSGQSPQQMQAAIRAAYESARKEKESLPELHPGNQLMLPYVPDPLARGAVFVGLPNAAEGTTVNYGSSPDVQISFRVRVIEGTAAPVFNEADRVLIVALPKAAVCRVRLSSRFEVDAQQLAIWRWIEEAAHSGRISDARLSELKRLVHEGRHWMITPFRVLTLVHAVQQPLLAPEIRTLEAGRFLGSTAAHLKGILDLHAPSTAKVDLHAGWIESVDDPARPADVLPELLKAEAHVLEIGVEGQPIDLPREFPDALRIEGDRRLVFNTTDASNFAAHLRQSLPAAPSHAERALRQGQIDIVERIAHHQFDDTKYRHVTYFATATSRFREYFAPEPGAGPAQFSRSSTKVEVDVLNSAPPPPPRPQYIVPTFAWETTVERPGTINSTRRGGGLRVYLDRPWYLSGAGELLGVVLGGQIASPAAVEYPYSTYWGEDPLWRSSRLRAATPSAFRSAAYVGTLLRLVENPGVIVTVVGHEVSYDRERQAWYCDINLDVGQAYYPFIRLALVRYQPHSIPGAHLSPVTLADFVQTVPDRSVSVSRSLGQTSSYDVAVSGVSYQSRRPLQTAAETVSVTQMEISIQKRDPQIPDPDLGWSALSEEATSVALNPGPPDERGTVTWTGRIVAAGNQHPERLRLVVREFEQLDAAPGAQSLTRRLVFVDLIQLSF